MIQENAQTSPAFFQNSFLARTIHNMKPVVSLQVKNDLIEENSSFVLNLCNEVHLAASRTMATL